MYTTVSTVVYSSVLYFTAHIRYSIYMPCIPWWTHSVHTVEQSLLDYLFCLVRDGNMLYFPYLIFVYYAIIMVRHQYLMMDCKNIWEILQCLECLTEVDTLPLEANLFFLCGILMWLHHCPNDGLAVYLQGPLRFLYSSSNVFRSRQCFSNASS